MGWIRYHLSAENKIVHEIFPSLPDFEIFATAMPKSCLEQNTYITITKRN